MHFVVSISERAHTVSDCTSIVFDVNEHVSVSVSLLLASSLHVTRMFKK